MSSTNFDLAPPGKTVDGLPATPIDIDQISATLTFDGATLSGRGDATVSFVVGPDGGCPIFDLRQSVTSAMLDGTPLTPTAVAHHDFGGGAGAQLRVLNVVLAAGSAHTLHVTYNLGPPQASTAGSYLPAMTWRAGPRLAFNFGFTDLGPGRYLEAWIPANLIFDQFALDLEIRLVNTTVPHTVITNGAVTALGANQWSVAFPAGFTALSHPPALASAGVQLDVYRAVGGQAFFEDLVTRFYDRVAADPVLRPLYPQDLSPSRRHLALFLAQYWGGPQDYSRERGHPMLRRRHFPFAIGQPERDTWVRHMTDAVRESGLDAAIETRLLAYFDTAATHLINREEGRTREGTDAV